MRLPAFGGAVAAALGVLLLAVAAGLAGYLTAGSSERGPAVSVPEQPSAVRGVVQGFSGSTLTLTTESGSVDVEVPQGTPVEALRPATLGQITPGDWINAGAFENQQTVFTLSGLVAIAPSQLRKEP